MKTEFQAVHQAEVQLNIYEILVNHFILISKTVGVYKKSALNFRNILHN